MLGESGVDVAKDMLTVASLQGGRTAFSWFFTKSEHSDSQNSWEHSSGKSGSTESILKC